jgi:plastocyanin
MRTAALTLAVAGLALVAGCASSSGPSAPAAGSSSSMSGMAGMGSTGAAASSGATTSGDAVTVKNFSFAPMSLTVPVGSTVTWTFDDSAKHTVTAKDKSFSSPDLSSGQTYKHIFTTAGTYQYICSIHQYMTGTIVVK